MRPFFFAFLFISMFQYICDPALVFLVDYNLDLSILFKHIITILFVDTFVVRFHNFCHQIFDLQLHWVAQCHILFLIYEAIFTTIH